MTIAAELITILGFQVTGEGEIKRYNRLQDRAAGDSEARSRRLTAGAAAWGRAGLAGGVAAAGGFIYATKKAADFEDSLVAIQKKAALADEAMVGVRDQIMEIANSGDVAVPIEEIASAMERAAAAGLPVEEWREFATLSAKAADAFEMSAEDVGNAAAGFKNVLHMTNGELKTYFDLINGLADSGIADERDIVNFVDRAGATMQTMGFSPDETAAVGATAGNIKMQPDVAARMMNSVLPAIVAPSSDKAEAALEKIVGNLKEFYALMKTNPMEGFMFFLDRVNKMDNFEALASLRDTVGTGFADEMMRLSVAQDELKKNQDYAANKTGYDGGLDKSYALKLGTLSAHIQMLQNKLSSLVIDAGTMGLPAVKDAIDEIIQMLGEVGDGFAKMKVDLDWTSIGEAKAAFVDLKNDLSSLLDIDTSGSQIAKFFEDLTGAINDAAAGINTMKEYADYFGFGGGKDGPDGKPAEPAAFGIIPDSPLDKARNLVTGGVETVEDVRRAGVRAVHGPDAAPAPVQPLAARFGSPTPAPDNGPSKDGRDALAGIAARLDNMNATIASTGGQAPMDAITNDNRQDNRSFSSPTSVTVNQNVTQASQAPAAAAQATGNAVAGAVNAQTARIQSEPAL